MSGHLQLLYADQYRPGDAHCGSYILEKAAVVDKDLCTIDKLLASTQIPDSHFPHAVLFIPLRAGDFMAHDKVLSDTKAINNILEILKDLITVRVEMLPVGILCPSKLPLHSALIHSLSLTGALPTW